MVWFGQSETSDNFSPCHSGQILFLLRITAVIVDGAHTQGALYAERGPVPGIDSFHFACQQSVRDVANAGTSVTLDRATQHTERTELLHDLLVEHLMPVRFNHTGQQLVLAVRPERIADRNFILLQL